MKRIIFILITTSLLSCCGVKESTEENSKWKSDLQARIVMKDSVIMMYKDSLSECQQDKRQLQYWKEVGK